MSEATPPRGHVFIVRANALRIDCDAIAVSTKTNGQRASDLWCKQDPSLDGKLGSPTHIDATRNIYPIERPIDDKESINPLPQAYLVPIAGTESSKPTWYTAAINKFLERAFGDVAPRVRQRLASNPFSRPIPRLVVPFLGSGKGGSAARRGELLRETLTTLWNFANAHSCDVVLVLMDQPAYDAAQAFRREQDADAWQGLDQNLSDEADRLAATALQGELALFLGAGVSMAAGLPSWNSLVASVAKDVLDTNEIKQLSELPLLDQAEVLERRVARSKGTSLGQRVADEIIRHRRYSLSHALLAMLPTREIVTTNYDRLFELALYFAKAPTLAALGPNESPPFADVLHTIPYDGPPFREKPWVMKLHGCVSRPGDIVLSRRTFLQYENKRAALAGMLASLMVTRHMLFVGSSFSDDNVLRIAEEVQRLWTETGVRQEPRKARLGTNLAVGSKPMLDELWHGDFVWVSMGDKGHGARTLEIFLDRMAASVSTGGSYLFDTSYAAMLREDEQRVLVSLEALQRAAEQSRNTAFKTGVTALLKQFGR